MIKKIPGYYFMFISVFAICTNIFSSPDVSKIQYTSAETKKLEKADKEADKAADKMKEADKMYADITAKQADLTAEETDKLNNKAMQKQIESLQQLKGANIMRFEVYSSKMDDFWKTYTGNADAMAYAKSLESSSRSKYQTSIDEYKDAESTEDKLLSYSKMTTASDDLTKSVDGMKQALEQTVKTTETTSVLATNETMAVQVPKDSIPKDTAAKTSVKEQESLATVPQPVLKPDTTTKISKTPHAIEPNNPQIDTNTNAPSSKPQNIYQAVKVDETMIDKFNQFLKEKYPKDYEKIIIDFSSLNFNDIQSLKDTWHNYIYGPELIANEQAKVDSIKKAQQDSALLASAKINNQNTDSVQNKISTEQKNKVKPGFNSDNTLEEANFSQKWHKKSFPDTSQVNGFTFKVQIAACRVPLNKELMDAIYNGNEIPEEIYNSEWYEYVIGPFKTYDEAIVFRESCGVKDAFIVGYINNRIINKFDALVKPQDLSKTLINFNTPVGVTFKVQVAASRKEIDTEELKKIYEKTEIVQNSVEDGWNKYIIDCGTDYAKACDLLKNSNVKGAFIAAYKDGVRVSFKNIFRK
jgi:hypothetical protein